MPKWDWTCSHCDITTEQSVMLAERDIVVFDCPNCLREMKREFAAEAIKGFQPFESHHDPSLGVDINGPGEKAEILRAMGFHESGDAVGGARNEETHSDAVMLDREPPTGRRLSDVQRDAEQGREERANFMVQTQDGDRVSTPQAAQDLPSPKTAKPITRTTKRIT